MNDYPDGYMDASREVLATQPLIWGGDELVVFQCLYCDDQIEDERVDVGCGNSMHPDCAGDLLRTLSHHFKLGEVAGNEEIIRTVAEGMDSWNSDIETANDVAERVLAPWIPSRAAAPMKETEHG